MSGHDERAHSSGLRGRRLDSPRFVVQPGAAHAFVSASYCGCTPLRLPHCRAEPSHGLTTDEMLPYKCCRSSLRRLPLCVTHPWIPPRMAKLAPELELALELEARDAGAGAAAGAAGRIGRSLGCLGRCGGARFATHPHRVDAAARSGQQREGNAEEKKARGDQQACGRERRK